MATVIKAKNIHQIRYPIPKGLIDAAGALKGKFPDGVKYQKKLRKEWGVRLKRQVALASRKA
jgi:hypothetical protein